MQSNRRNPQQQSSQQQSQSQNSQAAANPQQQQATAQPAAQPQTGSAANTASRPAGNRGPTIQTSIAGDGITSVQGVQPSGHTTAHAGRTTQPTVNINIQPDPITYQVEIETRVPIAFPLENALLNGLTNAAAVVNAQEQGNNGAAATRRQVLLGKYPVA